MNRETAKKIGETIEAALQSVGEELGVQIRARGGSFSATACQIKLEVSEISEEGVAKTPERAAFVQQAIYYGLSPLDLDQEFKAKDGTVYRIVGLSPRKRKYPIVAERMSDGKLYKFGQETVVRLLAETRADDGKN